MYCIKETNLLTVMNVIHEAHKQNSVAVVKYAAFNAVCRI